MRRFVLFMLLLVLCVTPASAHPGRTDSQGGHYDRSTGQYHWHHGMSAHQHYDMDGDGILDCPYTFKGTTATTTSPDIYTTTITTAPATFSTWATTAWTSPSTSASEKPQAASGKSLQSVSSNSVTVLVIILAAMFWLLIAKSSSHQKEWSRLHSIINYHEEKEKELNEEISKLSSSLESLQEESDNEILKYAHQVSALQQRVKTLESEVKNLRGW